jgi:hypothetical protein
MQLGDQLVPVEQAELEVREVFGKPPPVLVPRNVVLQILGESLLGQDLVADRLEVRLVGVPKEPHEDSTSATA